MGNNPEIIELHLKLALLRTLQETKEKDCDALSSLNEAFDDMFIHLFTNFSKIEYISSSTAKN